MNDYDAKNHIRDLHREAEKRRLVKLAKAGANTNRRKAVNLAAVISIVLLVLILAAQIY